MSFKPLATCLCGVLLVCGCSQSLPRSVDEVLNTPSNRQEAVALMQTVAHDVTANALNKDACRRFRQGFVGRLVCAGLSEQEICNWVALGTLPADRTDTREDVR